MTQSIGIIFQVRRGVSSDVAAFSPAAGEIIGDMTYLRECVGDGATPGGYPIGKTQLTAVTSSSYTVTANDVMVFFTSVSSAVSHTILLPPANAYPPGQELRIQDGTGTAGGSSIPITVQPSTTPNADTVNSTTTITINQQVGSGRTFITNGSTGWYCYST